MLRTHRLHADPRLAVGVETRHVTQHQAHFAGGLKALLHLLVQRLAVLEELIDGALLAARRHQRLDPHLVRFDVVARFARQDHQLAHHILAGEIDPRIRFGQPLLPGLIHQLGERHRAVILQEQPGKRAGENAADRQNAVAAVAQIAHRVVDRQTGADGGVVQPVAAGFGEGVANLAIGIAARGSRQLVGADHVETVAGEIQILPGQLFAGGHVEHHQIVERVRAHPQEQRLFVERLRLVLKERQCAAGVQPFVVQQAAAAVHHPRQDKFEAAARGNIGLLAGKQLQPARPNVALAEQHQTDALLGAE
ncbi:Uncharacterised protein [Serratia marcescens]|nr:Uncharacterised protein [Serratia marcescens]